MCLYILSLIHQTSYDSFDFLMEGIQESAIIYLSRLSPKRSHLRAMNKHNNLSYTCSDNIFGRTSGWGIYAKSKFYLMEEEELVRRDTE